MPQKALHKHIRSKTLIFAFTERLIVSCTSLRDRFYKRNTSVYRASERVCLVRAKVTGFMGNKKPARMSGFDVRGLEVRSNH